jgi:hypothetical protein
VVSADDSAVDCFLAEAPVEQMRMFLASCVERMAQLFIGIVGRDPDRRVDVDLAVSCLDGMWDLGSNAQWSDVSRSFSQMSEIAGDEEPSGISAYAYDAAACIYYGAEFCSRLDVQDIRHCANHALNSAGFVSELIGDGIDREEIEFGLQVADVTDLGGAVGSSVVSIGRNLRTRSQVSARARLIEVVRAFS